jgi:RNA polymerase sigma-70 factor (ECF subfamily)
MTTDQSERLGAGDPDDPQQDLLRKIAAGNSVAFDQLVHLHADRLYSLAYVMLRNRSDAEDAVQETFLAVFEGASKFAGMASVKTWITRILIKRIARIRRQRRWGKLLFLSHNDSQQISIPGTEMSLEHFTGNATQASEADRSDIRIDTLAAIASLKEEFRSVVMLRELQGFSYAQIAQILSLPVGTVESRLHRARSELKDKLADYHHKHPTDDDSPGRRKP